MWASSSSRRASLCVRPLSNTWPHLHHFVTNPTKGKQTSSQLISPDPPSWSSAEQNSHAQALGGWLCCYISSKTEMSPAALGLLIVFILKKIHFPSSECQERPRLHPQQEWLSEDGWMHPVLVVRTLYGCEIVTGVHVHFRLECSAVVVVV